MNKVTIFTKSNGSFSFDKDENIPTLIDQYPIGKQIVDSKGVEIDFIKARVIQKSTYETA